jgi:ERCC4-type nuclease
MIARPKISRNERKTTEIGAFEVGNFAPFCCPGELRSGLPRALHERGVAVSVETLAVGDYVLSRRHAVERKNVDTGDLDSSLESGRLWAQLRSLEHHYANPLLLLEFERKTRPLSLRPLPDSLHARHPVAKLAKCVLEYPNARLLWSPSAADTPALFAALAGGGDVDVAGAKALKDEQDFHRRALVKLPGVAEAPAAKRAFLLESDLCLADLATLTRDELGALLGPEAAAELAAFLDRDLRGGLREHEANVADGERPPKRPRKRR